MKSKELKIEFIKYLITRERIAEEEFDKKIEELKKRILKEMMLDEKTEG